MESMNTKIDRTPIATGRRLRSVRFLNHRSILLLMVMLSGCNSASEEPDNSMGGGTSNSSEDLTTGTTGTLPTPTTAGQGTSTPDDLSGNGVANSGGPSLAPSQTADMSAEGSGDSATRRSANTFSLNQAPSSVTRPSEPAGPTSVDNAPGGMPIDTGKRELRRDLTPEQLIDFLSGADEDMRLVVVDQNLFRDEQQRLKELRRIVTLKRQASARLMQHAEATEKQRVIGRRGTLQSLSHLASLGDLGAAEELEQLATEFRQDPDIDLSTDSQLVLIGFAIEKLTHGKEGAAETVVEQIQDLVESSERTDVASLMVMGQAKDALQRYGHAAESETVSQLIRGAFENAADPAVATMARQIAGVPVSEAWNALSALRETMLRNANAPPESDTPDTPTVQNWKTALDEFWKDRIEADAVELATVQFLAGLSLEAEVVGRPKLAAATYQMLREEVADRQDDLGREARTALQARKNRQQVIGQQLDPDLPSVRGAPLSMQQYRGQVVLMPFWSSRFPESLGLLPSLQAIRDQYADPASADSDSAVAIVGMNLDVADANPVEFMKQAGLDFASFRSVSDPTAAIVNEVAYRFGAVTLQYVVVVDQEGRVASVHFSDRDLQKAVAKLVE